MSEHGKLSVQHFTFNGKRLWLSHMFMGTYAVLSSEMTVLPTHSEEDDVVVGMGTIITFNATAVSMIAKAQGDDLAVVREALDILKRIRDHDIMVVKEEVSHRIERRNYREEILGELYVGITGHQMNEIERGVI